MGKVLETAMSLTDEGRRPQDWAAMAIRRRMSERRPARSFGAFGPFESCGSFIPFGSFACGWPVRTVRPKRPNDPNKPNVRTLLLLDHPLQRRQRGLHLGRLRAVGVDLQV